jgi:hypothetical protein
VTVTVTRKIRLSLSLKNSDLTKNLVTVTVTFSRDGDTWVTSSMTAAKFLSKFRLVEPIKRQPINLSIGNLDWDLLHMDIHITLKI